MQPFAAYGKDAGKSSGLASRCRACVRAYEAANKATIDKKHREWVKRNPDRVKAINDAWSARHPGRVQELHRLWAKRNPHTVRAHDHRKIALRKKAPYHEVTADDVEYIGIISGDPCSYCGERSGTVDHVVPLSRGGSNCWQNLAPACLSCNSSKSNRPLLLWMLTA